jgi:hypothetical protein
MEDYEKVALESAPLKICCWFRYIDNSFVIWQHGPNKLRDFLHHLNSLPILVPLKLQILHEPHSVTSHKDGILLQRNLQESKNFATPVTALIVSPVIYD